jgi:hypothetical protein
VRDRYDASLAPFAHDADLALARSLDVGQSPVSPQFGRLGPLPIPRAGRHSADGFVCAAGPGIAQGNHLAAGTPLDIAPTVLSLLGPLHSLPGNCRLSEAQAKQVA